MVKISIASPKPERINGKTPLLLAEIERAFAPEMWGTEKQIEWAKRIRAEFCNLENLQAAVLVRPRRAPEPQQFEILSTNIENAFAIAEQHDAAWWIENREKLYYALRDGEIEIECVTPF